MTWCSCLLDVSRRIIGNERVAVIFAQAASADRIDSAAVVLSGLGGVLGIGLGLAAAFGVAKVISIPFIVPPLATPIAFCVSVAVGIAFGVIPARKASRLNPLAALRFE